jgi:ribosomal protein S18 acetylase RimI-like enzyme
MSTALTTNLIIRDYRDSDFEEIQALWQPLGLGSSQRGDTAEVIRQTINLGGKLLVMEDETTGKIIGTSWMTIDGRRNYLHHFGIDQNYQGQGLGKMLLDASMEFAREMGLQLKIEVHRENQRALNLYTRYGFKYLGDYDVYIIRDI